MNAQTFRRELETLTLIPREILQKAQTVGDTLSDTERDRLMAALIAIHEELLPLEEKRTAELRLALAELKDFERSQVRPMVARRERSEKVRTLASIEQQFDHVSPRPHVAR